VLHNLVIKFRDTEYPELPQWLDETEYINCMGQGDVEAVFEDRTAGRTSHLRNKIIADYF